MRIVKIIAAALMSAALLAGCTGSKIASVDDLNGKRIGVQLGTVGDTYAADITDNVQRFNTGADAVNALKNNKIDAVLIDIEPARVYVRDTSGLRILDQAFTEEEYAIAVKKGSSVTMNRINSALAQLKEDGTLAAIESYWIDKANGAKPYVSPENTDRSGGTIVMATNAEFPPYEYMEGENIVGFDIDMMQAVCDVLGMELVINNIDFDSILTAVESGAADVGVAGITVTEEREEIVDFSDPYTTATQVIIVKK